jgi:hypothetical protein
MSYESPAIDHLSDEAQQRYGVHVATREALATLSAQTAVTGLGGPTSLLTAKYLNAVRGTTGMYIAGYRAQERSAAEISAKLLPRIGDEYRLFAEAELEIAQNLPGFSPQLQSYLDYRSKIDRSAVDAEITRVAGQELEPAMNSAITRLGTVVVAHIGDFVR